MGDYLGRLFSFLVYVSLCDCRIDSLSRILSLWTSVRIPINPPSPDVGMKMCVNLKTDGEEEEKNDCCHFGMSACCVLILIH